MLPRRAIIDVGSASLILSIFEGNVVVDERVIPWGSISVLEDGKLSRSAIEFLQRALDRLLEQAGSCGIDEIMVLATGIFRKAANGKDVLREVCEKYDVAWRILSPREEAILSYSACAQDFGEDIIVADVGGNSVDVSDSGEFVYSKEFGARVIAEKFGMVPPISEEKLKTCIERLSEEFSHIPRASRLVVVGSTGVLSSLFSRGLGEYHTGVHGTYIGLLELDDCLVKASGMKVDEIESMGSAFEGRGTLFLAGLVVLRALLDAFDFKGFFVSTKGFRHGAAIAGFWR